MTTIEPGLSLHDLFKYRKRIEMVNPWFYWRSVYDYRPGVPEVFNNIAFMREEELTFQDTGRPFGAKSHLYIEDAKSYRITHAYVVRKISGVRFHIRTHCND